MNYQPTPTPNSMLKGINPLLSPELLKIMMEMGHDDALVLVDANFTAVTVAAGKPIIRLPGSTMLDTVRAVHSLFPLVADATHPVAYMQVSDSEEGYCSELQREVLAMLSPDFGAGQSAQAVERFAFYERARAAYAIVVTGERQPFANFILRKGVICDPLRP
jgi:L-fucose mutarotase